MIYYSDFAKIMFKNANGHLLVYHFYLSDFGLKLTHFISKTYKKIFSPSAFFFSVNKIGIVYKCFPISK